MSYNTQLNSTQKAAGFAVLDMILVIGLTLTITAGLFYQNSLRQTDLKTTKLISDHKQITNAVYGIGNGRSDYFIAGNDWNSALGAAQAIPDGMNSTGAPNVFTNSFGGTVTLTPQEFQGPSSGGSFPGIPLIQLTYTNIPKKSCVKFAAGIAPESYDFKVNGTRVILKSQPDLSYVDLASASAACNQVANTIVATGFNKVPIGTLSNADNYSCPAGQILQGASCITATVITSAATTNYSCLPGYVLSGANCTLTNTYAGTPVYSCSSGVLSGSNCNTTNTYAASPVFQGFLCSGYYGTVFVSGIWYWIQVPGYGTMMVVWNGQYVCWYNESNEFGSYTYIASISYSYSYSCPSGGYLNASNYCVNDTTAPANVNYTCPLGGTASGSTCTNITTVPATIFYTCPAGQVVVGSTCTLTTTTSAAATMVTANMGATLGTKYAALLVQRRSWY
jgi:hypothetical protein